MNVSLLADGIILSEMYRIRSNYVRKEKIRISIGTWNINGDKNPALEDAYPSILDAWILNGPKNISVKERKDGTIPTIGMKIERLHSIGLVFFRLCQRRLYQRNARYFSHWIPGNLRSNSDQYGLAKVGLI